MNKKVQRVPYQITGKSFLRQVILEVICILIFAVGMRTKIHALIGIGIVLTIFVMPGYLILASLFTRKKRAEEWARQQEEAIKGE